MMQAALSAAHLPGWRYQLLPIPPEVFADTILALPGAGFRGVNVTIPHKEAALALADAASSAARSIGAANTLLFEAGGGVVAENTDAPALIAALPFSPRGRSALVLGAGGSARAAVWALLNAGASPVRVWNRHPERAQELAQALGAMVAETAVPADFLIHCTPVGMSNDDTGFKELPVRADELAMYECVVDLVYGRNETPLVQSARGLGVPVIDGLELLVGQGALSFERFTGLPAPLQEMRAAARAR
ncbi:MAG: shikimate dehydrogenase [Solirubrobacterales bacterium]|nr:shikimate dehydrogenase [Solirubrobacterales bacterium]